MAKRILPTWAETNTTVSNGDPNLAPPGSTLQTLGWGIVKPVVQHMNWMLNSLGHFIKANNTVQVKSSGYEAEAGENILIDNLAGSGAGLLPSQPTDRQKVSFGGVGPYSIHPVVVSGNGNDIMSPGTTDVELDMDGRSIEFVWDETTTLWHINLGNLKGEV